MRRREYFMIMMSIMAVLIFGGCSVNVKAENKNTAFENLDITVDEEKIDFDKSENDVDTVEKLVEQLGAWNDEYCGDEEENDMEHMEWYGRGELIYVDIEKKNSTMYQFIFQNEENESLKINEIGIGDSKKELEEKWEEEKREVLHTKGERLSSEGEHYDYDIIIYNNTCDIICTFDGDKLLDVTYEYDSTGQTVSDYREKNKMGYEGDYGGEEKEVTYPTEIHLTEKEKQEYARVIREYEEKYGEYQKKEVRKMSYLKLLDLKNDDTVQLMIGYADIDREYPTSLDYNYDIWDLEDEKAVKVDTGSSIRGDVGVEDFTIVEHEGQKYIVSGDSAPRCDKGLMYHGYKDGKFGIVRYEEIGEGYFAIDGKKISETEFNAREWKIDASDIIELKNYEVDLSDEICQVKEILNMEDNLEVDEDESITKEQYEEYVNKIMIPKYGKVENITELNNNSNNSKYWEELIDDSENWFAQKGIIATDIEDLNNDGKQECIVFYMEEEEGLHMAILSQQKGKIKESDNIELGLGVWFNHQFYIKTQGDKKYIVLQHFFALDGIGFDFYILSVTKDNTFFLEKGICDPGYTSGVGLYRFDTMAGMDYDDEENILYESDELNTKSDEYKQKLEKELEEYGLEIENGICNWYGGLGEMYVLKKDSTLKLIETMIGGLEIKTSEEN